MSDSYPSTLSSSFSYASSFKSNTSRLYTPTYSSLNGTHYQPWALSNFVQSHLLDLLPRLQDAGIDANEDELLAILHYKNWREDDAINAFFEDKEGLYRDAGLPLISTFETVNDFTCDICCETYPSTRTYHLQCNHKYCVECWHHYTKDAVPRGKLVRCMSPNCHWTIPHVDIDDFAPEAHKKALVENSLVLSAGRSLVDVNPRYKWCPATDCTDFTELIKFTSPSSAEEEDTEYTLRQKMDEARSTDLMRVPIVKCHVGHEFCFNCNYENHLPCPCWVVKLWVKKCSDDSETANWIEANTQRCPKCDQSIEKNGGCNHMTCKTCEYEFCWICSNDWACHNQSYYLCNQYKKDPQSEEKEQSKKRVRESLNRYIHFYKRFSIHETSMKLDNRVLNRINSIAYTFLENRRAAIDNATWSDVQFLPDAMRALHNGRKTLKWTYTFVFYLKDSNFQQIFESNQNYLNKTVEDMSELFEKIMDAAKKRNGDPSSLVFENRSRIVELAKLVNEQQKKLIEGANANLAEKLIEFV